MKCLAIILARGGSKRIPKKNIKEFLGKPIISYSIETAIKSNLFDTVMVSTDSNEIEELSKQIGASVPFKRSDKNSNDIASTSDALIEVIEEYEKRNIHYDYACCIYPTAPFITTSILEKAKALLLEEKFDTVFPVAPFTYPIQRAFRITENHKAEMFHPEHELSRSQDLEPAFHDAGQFYWFKVNSLKETKKLWTKNTGVLKISELQAQDIDTLNDWKLAELKYKLFVNE